MIEVIYIRAVEGVNYFAPVPASKLNQIEYELLPDEFYDEDDWSFACEFQSGDIVSVIETEINDKLCLLATTLIKTHAMNRKPIELRWKIIMENLPMNQDTINYYENEINKLVKLYKVDSRRFQYPIENWLNNYIQYREN